MRRVVFDGCCALESTTGAELMRKSEFDQLLVQTVDGALEDVLGAGVKATFYRYLERSFQTTRATLPNHVDAFLSALSMCLGHKASLIMGGAIAKRLYTQLGMRFVQKPGYSLLDYVTEAQQLLQDG